MKKLFLVAILLCICNVRSYAHDFDSIDDNEKARMFQDIIDHSMRVRFGIFDTKCFFNALTFATYPRLHNEEAIAHAANFMISKLPENKKPNISTAFSRHVFWSSLEQPNSSPVECSADIVVVPEDRRFPDSGKILLGIIELNLGDIIVSFDPPHVHIEDPDYE